MEKKNDSINKYCYQANKQGQWNPFNKTKTTTTIQCQANRYFKRVVKRGKDNGAQKNNKTNGRERQQQQQGALPQVHVIKEKILKLSKNVHFTTKNQKNKRPDHEDVNISKEVNDFFKKYGKLTATQKKVIKEFVPAANKMLLKNSDNNVVKALKQNKIREQLIVAKRSPLFIEMNNEQKPAKAQIKNIHIDLRKSNGARIIKHPDNSSYVYKKKKISSKFDQYQINDINNEVINANYWPNEPDRFDTESAGKDLLFGTDDIYLTKTGNKQIKLS